MNKKFVYQVGNNKKVILRCYLYYVTVMVWLDVTYHWPCLVIGVL